MIRLALACAVVEAAVAAVVARRWLRRAWALDHAEHVDDNRVLAQSSPSPQDRHAEVIGHNIANLRRTR